MFSKYKKVYIVSPPNYSTGGTLLLHQLAYRLIDKQINAEIVYIPNVNNPVHENFKRFNIPFSNSIIDSDENLLIVPEVDARILKKYSNINKVIWWLSIDNFYNPSKNSIFNIIYSKIIYYFRNNSIFNNLIFKHYSVYNKETSHFVQSYYASIFLHKNGVKSSFLSDYIDEFYTDTEFSEIGRKNIVLYNPKKGHNFVKKLMEYSSNINWVPLINYSYEEMFNILGEAKVYVDFGKHPGKDRIPREAASRGCCIITGLKGSAKYNEDIDILDKYKFEDNKNNYNEIIQLIDDIFSNYETHLDDFDIYRKKIKKEKSVFFDQIDLLL